MKNRATLSSFGAALGVLCAAGAANAAGPTVAIVAAASNTANAETNTRFTDVRDKLMATGRFAGVTIFNATRFGPLPRTPTLETLRQYDAVITWSNDSFDDAVAMGNVLADYVDSGGGVVVSVFANTSVNTMRFLQGRWQTGDYIAVPQTGGHAQGPGELGEVLVPDHPTMTGVTSFVTRWGVDSTGQIFGGYRPVNTAVTPGSTIIAKWNNGATLVALTPNPRVVELGFHPVSSDVVVSAYWDAATDGDKLIANALLHVIRPCAADWDRNGFVNSGDVANFLGEWFDDVVDGTRFTDVNMDGAVNSGDLSVFLGRWLNTLASGC